MATVAEIEAEIIRRQGMPQPPVASVVPPAQRQAIDGEVGRRQAIEAEIARRQAAESGLIIPHEVSGAFQPAEQAPEETDISQAILDMPGGAAVSEFASAVNRGTINLLDMVGPDVINNALAVIGSDKRVPTIGEQPIAQQATTGQFMEPGLAREAVRTAGEFVAPVGATGATLRAAAAQVPKLVAPTVTQRVVQAAAAPAIPELGAGALAGAGTEVGAPVGGAIGEAIAGEEGREVG